MRSFCDAEPIGQTNKGILATELELKLSLDEDARHRIAKLPVVRNFASGNAFRQRLRSTYFDPPDLSLSQKGTVLRVRQQRERGVHEELDPDERRRVDQP